MPRLHLSHEHSFSIINVLCFSQKKHYIIEALACGVPVVVTKCGGPEDIVDEMKSNGILVPVKNSDELSQAMLSMYENRGKYLREAVAEQARLMYGCWCIRAIKPSGPYK